MVASTRRAGGWALPHLLSLISSSLHGQDFRALGASHAPKGNDDATHQMGCCHGSWARELAYVVCHAFHRGELAQPNVVIFMSGLPGAGKSTIIEKRYRSTGQRREHTAVIDLDSEMVSHPRFDPADPDRIYTDEALKRAAYEWANARVERRFQQALSEKGSLKRIVLDGTGTNSERQLRRMRAAQEAGWFVKVLYVHIPLETAVRRAARRSRPVTASKIYQYQTKIGDALVQMAEVADEFEIFDAPSHDPAHVLMREGYVDKSRTIVAAEAEARRAAEMADARAMRAGREVG